MVRNVNCAEWGHNTKSSKFWNFQHLDGKFLSCIAYEEMHNTVSLFVISYPKLDRPLRRNWQKSAAQSEPFINEFQIISYNALEFGN